MIHTSLHPNPSNDIFLRDRQVGDGLRAQSGFLEDRRFSSQHPHGISHTSVTPDPTPSGSLWVPGTLVLHRQKEI